LPQARGYPESACSTLDNIWHHTTVCGESSSVTCRKPFRARSAGWSCRHRNRPVRPVPVASWSSGRRISAMIRPEGPGLAHHRRIPARSIVAKDQLTVVAGVGTGPFAEGLVERADIGKAEPFGDIRIADRRIGQPAGGLLLAQAVLDRLVLDPFGCQSATQGRRR